MGSHPLVRRLSGFSLCAVLLALLSVEARAWCFFTAALVFLCLGVVLVLTVLGGDGEGGCFVEGKPVSPNVSSQDRHAQFASHKASGRKEGQVLVGLSPSSSSSSPPSASSWHRCPREKVDLVILVPSHPAEAHRRQAIRKSWQRYCFNSWVGGGSACAGLRIRTLHVFAETSSNDTVVVDDLTSDDVATLRGFEEERSYRRRWEKTLRGFLVALERFDFALLLKADSDAFVHVDRLARLVRRDRLLEASRLYMGTLSKDEKPCEDPRHGWYDPWYDAVTGRKVYTTYARGPGYLLSRDLVEQLLLERLPAASSKLRRHIGTSHVFRTLEDMAAAKLPGGVADLESIPSRLQDDNDRGDRDAAPTPREDVAVGHFLAAENGVRPRGGLVVSSFSDSCGPETVVDHSVSPAEMLKRWYFYTRFGNVCHKPINSNHNHDMLAYITWAGMGFITAEEAWTTVSMPDFQRPEEKVRSTVCHTPHRETVDLVVVIPSHRKERLRRQAIRRTWQNTCSPRSEDLVQGSTLNCRDLRVGVLHVLGDAAPRYGEGSNADLEISSETKPSSSLSPSSRVSKNAKSSQNLPSRAWERSWENRKDEAMEEEGMDDVAVLRGFHEEQHYARRPERTLRSLLAAFERFDFTLLLKADSDSYVHLEKVAVMIRKHGLLDARGLYAGKLAENVEPCEDPIHKWYDPWYRAATGRNVYALHAKGAGYLLSRDVVERLLRERLPGAQATLTRLGERFPVDGVTTTLPATSSSSPSSPVATSSSVSTDSPSSEVTKATGASGRPRIMLAPTPCEDVAVGHFLVDIVLPRYLGGDWLSVSPYAPDCRSRVLIDHYVPKGEMLRRWFFRTRFGDACLLPDDKTRSALLAHLMDAVGAGLLTKAEAEDLADQKGPVDAKKMKKSPNTPCLSRKCPNWNATVLPCQVDRADWQCSCDNGTLFSEKYEMKRGCYACRAPRLATQLISFVAMA